MPITAPDIKLLESERMADTTDGGGRKTSRVIPDGVAGNIFPKVSRLDSVYGRVNLRKVYGAVQTADVDTYAGAHAVITDAPDNDKIHCTLFSTANEFDTRTRARDRIESYLTSGPESDMILYGRQLMGQQSVLAYQREEVPLPEIGEVYALSREFGETILAYQYFRIQEVDSVIRTFTDSNGDFTRRVLTINIGVPLRDDFTGPETPSRYSNIPRETKLRTTTVVDAARYFGIKPLAAPAAQSALSLKVSSVYSPIVPTTTRESPLANASMFGAIVLAPARTTNVTEITNSAWEIGQVRYTLRPIVRKSLTITGGGVSTLTDNGDGAISNDTFSAEIDYETGAITRTGGSASAGSYAFYYQPAGAAPSTAHTVNHVITLNTRGLAYPFTLNPLPAPATIYIDYRALGKWYRLRDTGAGEIAGSDPAYGVGSIDYATGSIVLTLGALPDIDTSILLTWCSGIHFKARAAADATPTGILQFLQAKNNLDSNSVTIDYLAGSSAYAVDANAAGVLSGDAGGNVDYANGGITVDYTQRLPNVGSTVAVNYTRWVTVLEADMGLSKSEAAATSFTLGADVKPGSFKARIPFSSGNFAGSVPVFDDFYGSLRTQTTRIGFDGIYDKEIKVFGDQIIGSINYTTGLCTLNLPVSFGYTTYLPFTVGGPDAGWQTAQGTLTLTVGSIANYQWISEGGYSVVGQSNNLTTTTTADPLYFDLTKETTERIIANSLMFTLAGKTYIDRDGSLYCDVSNITGAGTYAGTIDYTTGRVTLAYWTPGVTPSLAILACATTFGDYSTPTITFRTAGSPLRYGSFYIQATDVNGNLVSATSGENGTLSGTGVTLDSTIDQETGIAIVGFTTQVYPSTVRYNAVVLANLPLNSDLLGLDPVRLPMDGRVPIYRNADVAVIHNTGSYTLPNPVVAAATYNVGRNNLSELWLVDQTGTKVPTNQYVYSLANGTVTMGAVLNLTGLTQPFVVKHRVEDLLLISDVQINGDLTFSPALTRAYPAGTSYVSSAILFGDMAARVTNVHDLGAFADWSDTPGAGATAQYNDIDYPIEVLNNGALGERWRINFTSTTAYQVIGENLGVIATGSTSTDCSPTNTLTGNPYFVIRAAGWGIGWSAGNQLRFNTLGAAAPIWIARTVLPGATLEGDSFSLQLRGDVDAD